jgi:hypothetical protein
LFAASSGSASRCEAEIARGANVNVSPATGTFSSETPLLAAIPLHVDPGQSDHLDVVKCLVEHGADINLTPMRAVSPINPPIMKAATNQHFDIVVYLANHGAKVNTPLLPNGMSGGDTPMAIAITYKNLEAVQALVDNGADVRLKYFDRHYAPGETTLDLAQNALNVAAGTYKHRPNMQTRQRLDSACSIFNLLKSHGAETGPGSPVSGSPACSATPAQQAVQVSDQKQQDDHAMLDEVERSKRVCANGAELPIFYECPCVAQTVLDYRKQHGMHEPFTNVFTLAVMALVKHPECVAPAPQISKWGANRAYQVEGSNPKTKAQMPAIATCTGDRLASSFLAQPVLAYADGKFTSSLTACVEKYGN